MNKFNNVSEYFSHIDSQQVSRTEAKPVVQYEAIPGVTRIELDCSVTLVVVDHPAAYLNGDVVHTSKVVAVNVDRSFETLNTRYVLKAA